MLARWPQEVQWWYPGVIVESAGGGFLVQFDDGDRSQVAANEVRPLNVSVGDRVYGRWQGGKSYFPGKVASSMANAIHIHFDDGDQEVTSVSMVRVNADDLT